jgi:hypothetical protein
MVLFDRSGGPVEGVDGPQVDLQVDQLNVSRVALILTGTVRVRSPADARIRLIGVG